MTTLETRLKDDVKAAMKAGAREDLEVLRMLLSEAKNAAIAAGIERSGIPDDVMLGVLRRGIKTRTESAEVYAKGGRQDLADRETAQMEVIRRYLPAELPLAELEALAEAVIAELGASTKKDMGRVMKALMERVGGRADGSTVSKVVSARLA